MGVITLCPALVLKALNAPHHLLAHMYIYDSRRPFCEPLASVETADRKAGVTKKPTTVGLFFFFF